MWEILIAEATGCADTRTVSSWLSRTEQRYLPAGVRGFLAMQASGWAGRWVWAQFSWDGGRCGRLIEFVSKRCWMLPVESLMAFICFRTRPRMGERGRRDCVAHRVLIKRGNGGASGMNALQGMKGGYRMSLGGPGSDGTWRVGGP